MRRPDIRSMAWSAAAVAGALAVTSAVLLPTGASPIAAFSNILAGAVGSPDVAANVIASWIPLFLVSCGLVFAFTAGLWNIGIEGQVTMGAIFSTWTLRLFQASAIHPALALALATAAGMAGGMLWAALAGALKTGGGVNEIFGGLGLNFVATALNLWLIFGPWKRPGIASMSGTQPFPEQLWMPAFSGFPRLSPVPLAFTLIAMILVRLVAGGTRFGLELRAVGMNPRSAELLGIPVNQRIRSAFMLCGLLAGLAGTVQVTAVYHRLIPSISSGYGYLGLLVAMLSGYDAVRAAPVALFFAALNVGSIRLPIVLRMDSSLAGVIQGFLVLSVLLARGFRGLAERRRRSAS